MAQRIPFNERFKINDNGKANRFYKSKPATLGWAVYETIGVAIINPRGIAAGKKSVIIGE